MHRFQHCRFPIATYIWHDFFSVDSFLRQITQKIHPAVYCPTVLLFMLHIINKPETGCLDKREKKIWLKQAKLLRKVYTRQEISLPYIFRSCPASSSTHLCGIYKLRLVCQLLIWKICFFRLFCRLFFSILLLYEVSFRYFLSVLDSFHCSEQIRGVYSHVLSFHLNAFWEQHMAIKRVTGNMWPSKLGKFKKQTIFRCFFWSIK